MIEWQETDLPLTHVDAPDDAHRLTIDPERVAALADDIAAHGLLQRVGARGPSPDGRYQIIWGHRRLLAHRLLERATIAARVCPWDTDALHARAMENLGAERLTPLEEAHICARYRERGLPVSAIARMLRHSPGWVESRLALLQLPDDLQAAVQAGDLSLVVAAELAAVDDDGYRRSLVGEATRAGATGAVVRAWVAHYEQDKARILSNHYNVEELALQRETFVLKARCDGCGGEGDVRQSRALHLCPGCFDEIRQALAVAAVPPAG
jgi:ParB/RepB/Spo0J family partition protein